MQMSLYSSGLMQASKIVKDVTLTSPMTAEKYQTALKQYEKYEVKQLSGEEALSITVDAKLTHHQYNIIRSKDKLRFPSYKIIQNTKKTCYHSKEYISITSTPAEIKLQALLDHTTSRLLDVQKEVLCLLLKFKIQKNFIIYI